MAWNYLPLNQLPNVNDIVWCRFPHEENLTIPGDKCRPVVVHSIERNARVGRALVTVRQGTSIKSIAVKIRYEFSDLIIDKPEEMKAHGLIKPTRFDLRKKKCVEVVWAGEFFCWPQYAVRLRIGSLDENCIRRMNNRLGWRASVGRT
jgi:hypothetical protein